MSHAIGFAEPRPGAHSHGSWRLRGERSRLDLNRPGWAARTRRFVTPHGPGKMRPTSSVLALALAITVAMVGCATHQAVQPGHGGTVTGMLIFGGPGRIGPVPGQVMAANPGSGQFTATAGDNGQFRLYLPPGRYQLTGQSPKVTLNGAEVRCSATHLIHVTARTTTRGIKVTCYLI